MVYSNKQEQTDTHEVAPGIPPLPLVGHLPSQPLPAYSAPLIDMGLEIVRCS